MKYLFLFLVAFGLCAYQYPPEDFTAAWAFPHRYAVIWHNGGHDPTCVVRVNPQPDTVIGCGPEHTHFLLRVTGAAEPNTVYELRKGSEVLGVVTLGPLYEVQLPMVTGE